MGSLLLIHCFTENETITALPDHSKNVDETMDEMLACIVASILLFLLILWTAALYIMWKQKRKRRTVEMHQNIQDAIIYSNTDSSLGFHNRVMAVDNIYQLETENEYERWS
ncbi:hypothetical protein P4O66_016664 [Electrophorus voltai]|uniref:Uncharacterized protein n=1 Tax=Electrophorus voltai TaxID=2609070 RepID=A0AAD8YYK0_9TELE|nr:hypothetical protein P4O66_016664 [Electrophorus voltai]